MLLLIYLFLLFLLFNFRKKISAGTILICLYCTSLLGAMLIGSDYEINSFPRIGNFVFLIIVLSALILPWNKFTSEIELSKINEFRLKTLTKYLFIINGIVFLLFFIVMYFAFMSIVDYSSFKNVEGNAGLINQIGINNIIYLLALYLYPTSYFLVPIHFYYLINKNYKKSFIALLLSTNIILYGLTIFSRSGFIEFALLYLVYLVLFFNKLGRRPRRLLIGISIPLLGLCIFIFSLITSNRFEKTLMYVNAVQSKSFTNSPALYSILDYLSQWYKNGFEVMEMYSYKTLNGQLSLPFFYLVADKLKILPYSSNLVESELWKLWGNHFDKFNGISSNLLFDFGYFGTIIFMILYLIIVNKLKPFKGEIVFNKFLILGIIFLIPATGIFNFQLKSTAYNVLIFYAIAIYKYMEPKYKMVRPARDLSN